MNITAPLDRGAHNASYSTDRAATMAIGLAGSREWILGLARNRICGGERCCVYCGRV